MAKKKEAKLVFELLVSKQQLKDYKKFYSVFASPTIEELVIAHEDEEQPLDGDVVEVAVYHFVGYEKYKKAAYTRVEEE